MWMICTQFAGRASGKYWLAFKWPGMVTFNESDDRREIDSDMGNFVESMARECLTISSKPWRTGRDRVSKRSESVVSNRLHLLSIFIMFEWYPSSNQFREISINASRVMRGTLFDLHFIVALTKTLTNNPDKISSWPVNSRSLIERTRSPPATVGVISESSALFAI